MRKPTIKDVAQLADVSVGTVSMVLNNSNKVKHATKEMVLEAINKLQYKRNPYARSLSLSKSNTIGLVVTDLTNPYFGMTVEHIQKEVDLRNNSLMIGVSQDTIRIEKKAVEHLVSSGVDGLILVPAYVREPDLTHIYDLIARDFPLVFLSSYYSGVPAGCVMTDLAKGSYNMTRTLLMAGHKKILFIGGFRELVLSQKRLEGFIQAHCDFGFQVSPEQIIEVPLPNYQNGYEAAKAILSKCKPDAIMTINDVLSMGVLGYLHESGISVPDDISVAGYDDLIYSEMLETPLTTVRQPIKDMCAEAVNMLFTKINGGSLEQQTVLLEPQLTIRASTKLS